MSEAVILKIVKFGLEGFICCKNLGCCYPEFSVDNFYVNASFEVGKSSETNGKEFQKQKETKMLHPFLFNSFYDQLERVNTKKKNVKKGEKGMLLLLFV